MSQVPFSVYDFFGYLASGAVVLAACAAAFFGYEPFEATPNLLVGFLLVILIYILGQVIANVAGDIIERRLVRGRLGTPTDLLLEFSAPNAFALRWFPGYCKALPPKVRAQVRERSGGLQGDDLFFHCHAVMKSDATVQARLETFINLYGFCRNMAFALAVAAVALVLGVVLCTAETGPVAGPGWWVGAALLSAVGLFYRYLKFYRHYAVELFVSYAEREAS